MRFVYDILFFFFALLYLPVFFIKGKHRGGFGSRFGIVPEKIKASLAGKKVIWIHAVSVGEIGLAVRLANALREKLNGARFVLTTTTLAGHAVGEKMKNEEDTLLYFPVDFRGCVRRFIKNISPCAMILLETEIWPNLIAELKSQRIPSFIMNGRISDKAMSKYRRWRSLFGGVLRQISAIGAQDERMRSRFVELGASPEKVFVTGNLKFDWQPSILGGIREDWGHAGGKGFLCVAGSTHSGEEAMLFQVFTAIRQRHPDFHLVIAPRHLERLASIETEAQKNAVRTKRLSNMKRNGDERESESAVMLLDEMGVLASFYALADAAFIGGSLVPKGGHNLVEPAFFEKAVLHGPFMDNFVEMAEEFKRRHAAIQVTDAKDLEREIESLMVSPERRRRLGEEAKKLVASHQGATQKNLNLFLAVWEA